MILGAEIGMLVVGLIALFSGKFKLSGGRQVEGPAARWAGAVLILPLPLAFAIGLVVGVREAARGRVFNPKEWELAFALVEVGLLLLCGVIAAFIVWSAPSGEPERHGRSRDSEEENL